MYKKSLHLPDGKIQIKKSNEYKIAYDEIFAHIFNYRTKTKRIRKKKKKFNDYD